MRRFAQIHCSLLTASMASTNTDKHPAPPADTTEESSTKKRKVEEPTTEEPKKQEAMPALRLGAVAPDFHAKTTQGVSYSRHTRMSYCLRTAYQS